MRGRWRDPHQRPPCQGGQRGLASARPGGGTGFFWTPHDNPADDYWFRIYTGEDDRDTICGDGRIVGEALARSNGISILAKDVINSTTSLDDPDGGPGNDSIHGGQNKRTARSETAELA